MERAAYLDTSAYVKLYVKEAESAALERELLDWPVRTSSVLLSVEAVRACRRFGESFADAARDGIDLIALLELDEPILVAARRLDPPALRALDAIHLATALSLGTDLGALFTYDNRLADAATAAGVRVLAPA